MEKNSRKPVVLVTGGSGMLGKALMRLLPDRYEAVGVSKRGLSGSRPCDLSSEKEVEAVFASVRPALVVHTAAYSDVDGCERDPKLAFESNVSASKNLSRACAKAGIPWIYVSTDYVFGDKKEKPYTEDDIPSPVNIYGITKWLGEFYALNGAAASAVVRTSWLFGAENPSNFVNAILDRLRKESSVSVLDDQLDSPTHVKDLSAALIKVGEHLMGLKDNPVKAFHEIFHVCNSGETTRYEMTAKMNEWLNLKKKVEKTDRAQIKGRLAVRWPYLVMSTKKYENFSGQKMRPWQESLKEYVTEAVSCAS